MTKEEEIALRELAAGQCTINKVVSQIGPMSLWSKSGLEAEIRKAVEAEREACADVIDKVAKQDGLTKEQRLALHVAADAIRARNN